MLFTVNTNNRLCPPPDGLCIFWIEDFQLLNFSLMLQMLAKAIVDECAIFPTFLFDNSAKYAQIAKVICQGKGFSRGHAKYFLH